MIEQLPKEFCTDELKHSIYKDFMTMNGDADTVEARQAMKLFGNQKAESARGNGTHEDTLQDERGEPRIKRASTDETNDSKLRSEELGAYRDHT